MSVKSSLRNTYTLVGTKHLSTGGSIVQNASYASKRKVYGTKRPYKVGSILELKITWLPRASKSLVGMKY